MGKPRQDLIGKTFYRLKVIERHGSDPKAGTLWLCQCNCGNKIIVSTCDLNKGRVKSCGCLRKEIASERVNKENYLKKYQIKDTNVTLLNSKLSKANKVDIKEFGTINVSINMNLILHLKNISTILVNIGI